MFKDNVAGEATLSGRGPNGRIMGYLGKPVDVAELSRLLAALPG